MKQLNNLGFSHIFIPLLIMIGMAVVGTYFLVMSHAAPISTKNPKLYAIKQSPETFKAITTYSLAYWGRPTACNNGKEVKYTYYNHGQEGRLPNSLRNQILSEFNAEDNGKPGPIEQQPQYRKFQNESLAYAGIGAGNRTGRKLAGHCHIYINKNLVEKNFNDWKRVNATNLNAKQFTCAIMVHEFGHLMGYSHTIRGENGEQLGETRLAGDQFNIMRNFTEMSGNGQAEYAKGCLTI